MGEERHANTVDIGRAGNDCCAREYRPAPCRSAKAPFPPVGLPLDPLPVEIGDARHHRGMSLGDLVEPYTAWARRLLVELLPQTDRFNFANLSSRLTRWTGRLRVGPLA